MTRVVRRATLMFYVDITIRRAQARIRMMMSLTLRDVVEIFRDGFADTTIRLCRVTPRYDDVADVCCRDMLNTMPRITAAIMMV